MFLRVVLIIGAVSQACLAVDFGSTSLFADQNTGNLRELNKQALDRQIRSSLLGKGTVGKNRLLPPLQPNYLFPNGRTEIASGGSCAIPLTRMKVGDTKHYTMNSQQIPKPDFDSIAKAPPVPACKD
ncbi:MAG: hypothetical protein JO028_18220 [Acidobacteriaceae bacterium]|nr:hypothetical protein [Acidobacteriaceae bacterium]